MMHFSFLLSHSKLSFPLYFKPRLTRRMPFSKNFALLLTWNVDNLSLHFITVHQPSRQREDCTFLKVALNLKFSPNIDTYVCMPTHLRCIGGHMGQKSKKVKIIICWIQIKNADETLGHKNGYLLLSLRISNRAYKYAYAYSSKFAASSNKNVAKMRQAQEKHEHSVLRSSFE